MRTMARVIAGAAVLGLLVAGAFAGEAAKPRSVDDVINALNALNAPDAPPRKAEELEADYAFVVGELAKGLAGDDMSKWAGTDPKLERLTYDASAPGREAHRAACSKALVAQIKAPGLTALGGERVIRHLQRIGSGEAVPALAALLADKALREPARRALMRNPTPAAGDALRAALAGADKEFRIALIDALGFRREAVSVQPLLPSAADADDDIRTHAAESLALLADPAAIEPLAAAMGKGSDHAKQRAVNAYLLLAEGLAAKGQKDAALKIYGSLLGSKSHVKCGALIGIGKAGSAKDVDTLVAALITPIAAERGAATEALIALPDKAAGPAIAAKAGDADPAVKAILIGVLGKRGDLAVVDTVLAAAKDKDEAVRVAAYEALGNLKAEKAAAALIAALKAEKDATRDKAEWALGQVPGKEATQAIVAALAGADKEAKCVLLRSLGYRKDADALPTLLAAAKDPDEDVRVAALMAVGQLNQVKALPAILEALNTAQGKVLEAAAYALRRTHGEEANAAIVAAARTAPPAALAPILQILSRRDDPAVKGLLLASAKHADPGVRAAALEGLVNVKDPAAVPLIIEAGTKGEGAVRDAAVRASLAYAAEIVKADKAAAAALFGLALDRKIVPEPDDQKVALRALGEVGGPEVIDALAHGFRDRRISGDAHDAVQKIADGLAKAGKKEAAVETYTKLARLSNDRGRIGRAQGELRKLGVEGDLARRVGFVTRWSVAGPFPNPNNALFNQKLEPEKAGVDMLLPVEAAGASREWKPLQVSDPAGVIDLGSVAKEPNTGALLYAEFTVPKAEDALLKLGYEEGCIAYLNGKQVHSRAGSRLEVDDQRVKVKLNAGVNKLLLKVVHQDRGWAVAVRVTGLDDSVVEFTQAEK